MQDISKEVLIKASAGDLSSFELIYRSTSRFVYNVAYRVVGHRQEAEEITQEVFMTVYHKLRNFRLESSLKTWIYRITVNCALNHSQKISKERKRMTVYDESLNQVAAQNDTDKEINRTYDEGLVNALLGTLNPDQRTCVVLRNMEGLSYQGIADVLKININTVRSRLKRAREMMMASRKEVKRDEL